MKRKIVLLVLLLILSAGCTNSFDLSQVKILPLGNPQLTLASLSQEVCPRCASYSVLNGGKYIKLNLGGSISPTISYNEDAYSKKIGATGTIQYCSNCGFMDVAGTVPTVTLADLFPDGLPREIALAKAACK